MYHHKICPSLGAASRKIASDGFSLSTCTARRFHASARCCEDPPSKPEGIDKSKAAMRGITRRTRQDAAVNQIQNLQQSPSQGFRIRRSPTTAPIGARPGPESQGQSAPRSGGSTPGNMIKAPSALRFSRGPREGSAPGARPTGTSRPRGRTGGPKSGDSGPRQRTRKPKKDAKASPANAGTGNTLEEQMSDGFVQQMLRLQRKEWDTTKYEPKYAHGSAAAQDLVEQGKKFFEGEKPVVHKPTRLHKALGIVGMHGLSYKG